ncbi:IS66 family insertion sequence element accessory protein TnpB [Brevibacillus agri]|nr:IS66 family insertion sequence element accessory protein TnpB [Brevibacillus agri]
MRHDYTGVKKIYIICGKTDMRKGIDGLATLIQDSFELDPYSDSIFLFSGWSKDRHKLYQLERKFKHLSPSKRRKKRQKHSNTIVEKFLNWIDTSPFFGKNALAKVAEYTLNRANGLKSILERWPLRLIIIPLKTPSVPMLSGEKIGFFGQRSRGKSKRDLFKYRRNRQK